MIDRDRGRCQMPGCGYSVRRHLQAHHIVRWADSVFLRYDVSNGITLCKRCHYRIRNKESAYVELFKSIVREK